MYDNHNVYIFCKVDNIQCYAMLICYSFFFLTITSRPPDRHPSAAAHYSHTVSRRFPLGIPSCARLPPSFPANRFYALFPFHWPVRVSIILYYDALPPTSSLTAHAQQLTTTVHWEWRRRRRSTVSDGYTYTRGCRIVPCSVACFCASAISSRRPYIQMILLFTGLVSSESVTGKTKIWYYIVV